MCSKTIILIVSMAIIVQMAKSECRKPEKFKTPEEVQKYIICINNGMRYGKRSYINQRRMEAQPWKFLNYDDQANEERRLYYDFLMSSDKRI